MKSIVFISSQNSIEVQSLSKVLNSFYSVHSVHSLSLDTCTQNTLSIEEFVNNRWDYIIVVNDYNLFLSLPLHSTKIFIWKTHTFQHPIVVGVDLSNGYLLSNLVHDGIIKSSECIDGEGMVLDSIQKWLTFLDVPSTIPSVPFTIPSVPSEKITIGLRCNWTKDLISNWKNLVPPNFPFTLVNGDGNYTFIFNGCDREPVDGDILTTMEPECNRWHIPAIWRSKPRSIQRNMIEWHLSLPWKELEKPVINKTKELSAIISGENRLEGHRKRLALISYLDDKYNYDLYGRYPHKLSNYKGNLHVKDPGTLPYKYHIAVENCSENGYFTEKIVDGILSECLCFYWGCPDIDQYIDSRAYIRLPLDNLQECLQIISESIRNNEWEKRLKFIRNEKWRIMNVWSIFPTIQRYIEEQR